MKAHKLKIMVGCVALAVSSSSWAAQSETHAHLDQKVDNSSSEHVNVGQEKGKTLLPQLNDDIGLGALFDNAHSNIKLRTVYFNQHLPKGQRAGTANKDSDEDQSWRGSAFSQQFNFHSGYAWNHVGFDWSVFNTLGLSSGGNNANADGQLLSTKANGDLRGDIFKPAGIADIKFKTGDDTLNFSGKAGLIEFDSDFLAGSSTRAIPATYRGIHLNGNMYGLNVYLNAANGLSMRADRGIDSFQNSNNQKVSYVAELGTQYAFDNGLGLKASYGEGKNYLKQFEGQATYSFVMPQNAKLNLKGQYFHAMRGGDLWNGDAATNADGSTVDGSVLDGFKSTATANSLSASYIIGGLNLGLAYTKTQAKGGAGFYQYKLAENDYGAYNAPTSVDSDFNFDGENAYQGSVDYKFDCIPGFEATVIYTMGNGIDTSNTAIKVSREHEMDYGVSYDFQQPALKGLQLSAIDYDIYQDGANGYKDGHTNDLRVYADYTVAVF